MTLIALEEHILPAELAGRVGPGLANPPALAEALAAHGADRLAVMDAAGIDIQVLSVPPPGAQTVDAVDAVTLARELNDRVAAVAAAHPTRFRAMATLPMPDPAAAVAELRRTVGELGFCGVLINGHTDGRFLDAPEFAPVLAAIEELDIPLYLHPTMPPPGVADIYFGGLEPQSAAMLSSAGWGWHAETGLHILRMVMGGVFDRYRGLQVVIGHMGENLPFSLMRSDAVLSRLRPGLPSVADTVREHVHLTICGYTTVPPLQCALAVFGADRLLFSADYPFGDSQRHAEFLAAAPISPADREKIAHLNAERLFRL